GRPPARSPTPLRGTARRGAAAKPDEWPREREVERLGSADAEVAAVDVVGVEILDLALHPFEQAAELLHFFAREAGEQASFHLERQRHDLVAHPLPLFGELDRKSTRLNSSHVKI